MLHYYQSIFENNVLDQAKNLNAIAIHPRLSVLNQEIVDKIHSLGLLVYSWTINEPQHISKAMQLGIDGIITDFPDRIMK